jgi:hypothetical protein
MPHSLYVGSSLVHARLREFDIKEDLYPENGGESTATTVAYNGDHLTVLSKPH